ncbi:MAG: aminotransferase class IV [Bacteroidales bacterium]|nr:aminotransferase class IV [Bacteroidales bacterium]
MSLLLESIRINQGKPDNLSAHEERISRSQLALEGIRQLPPLEKIFKSTPPPNTRLLKARIVYNSDMYKIDYHEYSRAIIKSLQVCQEKSIYYPHKFANRRRLNNLKKTFPKYTEALIVIGNRITDTTFTNLAFWNGKKWLSPMYPLLPGTRRASLINQGLIELHDIQLSQLMDFEKVRLFNAMMPWDEAIEISISQVKNHY